MPYQVTLAEGLSNVVLPDGLRHRAGDVVTLTDDEYGMLSATALDSYFSSAVQQAGGGVISGAVAPEVSTVEYESTVTLPATANVLTLTLAGACTINAPASAADGQSLQLRLNCGSDTVTWGTGWDWGTAGAPTLGTTGWNWVQATRDEASSNWAAGLAGGGFS